MRSPALIAAGFAFICGGCNNDSQKTEAIRIVCEVIPDFEHRARVDVANEYGVQYLDSTSWEWRVEEDVLQDTYDLEYGCFSKPGTGKELAGDFVGELTSELTGGLLSVTPWSGNTGIVYRLTVNIKERRILPKEE